jgi:hypothetical protein
VPIGPTVANVPIGPAAANVPIGPAITNVPIGPAVATRQIGDAVAGMRGSGRPRGGGSTCRASLSGAWPTGSRAEQGATAVGEAGGTAPAVSAPVQRPPPEV